MKFLLQVRFNGADKVIGALPAEEQAEGDRRIRSDPPLTGRARRQPAPGREQGGDGPRGGRDSRR